MPPRSTFPLFNAALHGTLAARLTAWRAEGLSYRAIEDELALLNVEVDHETVRRWCRQLEAAS